MLQLIMAGVAAITAFIFTTGPLAAQTLDKVKQRGVLVVGTKADYKPFGFRDTSGAIVGFEPDLARDVAGRLGVRLELEPVVSSNRTQVLQQGKIDLMLATMNVTQDRRQRSASLIQATMHLASMCWRSRRQRSRPGSNSRIKRSARSRAPGITRSWLRNTVPKSSRFEDRRSPRLRCFKATASGGCTTTRRSWNALETRNGRRLRCRWKPFWTSRGAPPSSLRSATGR